MDLVKKDNLEVKGPDYKAAWKDYKEVVKEKSKRTKIETEREFTKVVKECFRTISYLWTNSTGGIYMKDVGYFTLLRPIRKFQKEGSKEYINNVYRTHGYSYLLTHITSLKSTDSFGGFKLRLAHQNMKLDVRKNIINGRRYTINSSLIKEHIKRRIYL